MPNKVHCGGGPEEQTLQWKVWLVLLGCQVFSHGLKNNKGCDIPVYHLVRRLSLANVHFLFLLRRKQMATLTEDLTTALTLSEEVQPLGASIAHFVLKLAFGSFKSCRGTSTTNWSSLKACQSTIVAS